MPELRAVANGGRAEPAGQAVHGVGEPPVQGLWARLGTAGTGVGAGSWAVNGLAVIVGGPAVAFVLPRGMNLFGRLFLSLYTVGFGIQVVRLCVRRLRERRATSK